MNFASYRQWLALAALGLLLLTPPAQGQAGKGAKAKQAKKDQAAESAFTKQVNAAVDNGVKYLRSIQDPTTGVWPHQTSLGATSLAGLALLEAGVPANDPAITRAADAVRRGCIAEDFNYTLSTAILFLDRLGDPQDVPLIEALAVRLLAGQDRRPDKGGWGYNSPAPGLAEIQLLQAVVQNRQPWMPPKGGAGAGEKKPRSPKDLPKDVREQIERIYQGQGRAVGEEIDLSNTQFALIALWVARRHGIPTERAFLATESRLRRTQRPNGGWGYHAAPGNDRERDFSLEVQATPQMTCAALMGLAMSYIAVPDPGGKKRDMSRDPVIEAGFKALLPVIGTPRGVAAAPLLPRDNSNRVYYTLWTLERMAVLFDLQRMGGKDWYKWGAEILLKNQQADGSWRGGYARGGPDTCFAVLFLKRANLTADLTVRIKKAPGAIKLLEGITDGEKTKSDLAPAPRGPKKQSRLAPAGAPDLRPPYLGTEFIRIWPRPNLECGEHRRFGIFRGRGRCQNAKAAMLAALQMDTQPRPRA